MPHLAGAVFLRSTFGKQWRPSRHPTLHLKLHRLFPFCKVESNTNTKPSRSPSSSFPSSSKKNKRHRKRLRGILLILRRSKRGLSEMDKVGELPEFSRLSEKIYPSPVTPAYVKNMAKYDARTEGGRATDDEVEDGCKSFEKYVMEMIVDDGRVGDLADVEELLYCWQNLRCPVYMELVCQFYAEMCEDMLSTNYIDEELDDAL